jgi:hypothetical protein
MVDSIHPNQPVRFMVAWVPDNYMTQAEFKAHLTTMTATVQWDDHPPEALVAQRSSASWEALWNCYPWAIKIAPVALR